MVPSQPEKNQSQVFLRAIAKFQIRSCFRLLQPQVFARIHADSRQIKTLLHQISNHVMKILQKDVKFVVLFSAIAHKENRFLMLGILFCTIRVNQGLLENFNATVG